MTTFKGGQLSRGAFRVLLALFLSWTLASMAAEKSVEPEEGLAIAIVYDTSGSMLESVREAGGKMVPKYQSANRALLRVIDRLEAFRTNSGGSRPFAMQGGLFIFKDVGATAAVPFGAFDANKLRTWARNFAQPNGTTPLGEAVRAASKALLTSNLKRKHILVLTDGMNTAGADPAVVIPQMRTAAEKAGTAIECHFVAFDVAAKVFDPIKKLGVTVVPASNEMQLNTQLGFILEEKILLEAEEPVKPSKK